MTEEGPCLPETQADGTGAIWYVYILRCADRTLYTGVSTEPHRRLDQHTAGRGARYTRGRGPLDMVYLESQPSRIEALRRERAIKRMDREGKEALVKRQRIAPEVPAPSDATPGAAPLSGILYLVPTPVGNLEDITRRAERILAEADLVLAEDTRHTGRLLQHLGLKRPLLSYHDQNERGRMDRILALLGEGQRIALVSDAGSPVLSDPGFPLVREAIARGARVEALPGPTALVPALTASGLPPHPFRFVGFLPRTEPKRRRLFEALRDDEATLVAYESPHRIRRALADALAVLGPRPACVAREISKMHETYHRGTLAELPQCLPDQPVGEMVLVIAGAQK